MTSFFRRQALQICKHIVCRTKKTKTITFGADLIALTTHGYTGLKRVWLGSTAERVVRHATLSGAAVRELKAKKDRESECIDNFFMKNVCGTYFSQLAIEAADVPAALAAERRKFERQYRRGQVTNLVESLIAPIREHCPLIGLGLPSASTSAPATASPSQ